MLQFCMRSYRISTVSYIRCIVTVRAEVDSDLSNIAKYIDVRSSDSLTPSLVAGTTAPVEVHIPTQIVFYCRTFEDIY